MKASGIQPPPKGADANSSLFLNWFEALMQAIPKVQTFNPTLAPAQVPTGGNVQTFTVKGLQVGDIVTVNKTSFQAGLSVANAWVSAANTLSIGYGNSSGSPITPNNETYYISAIRL